ncbi:MAG: hypothetical protein Q7S32_03610 [bacterium]|nr:hypothetical protein [bacterium]
MSNKLIVKAIDDLTLDEMVAMLREIKMTSEEEEAQRISFAYGNVKLSNPAITLEMVIEAARKHPRKK